MSDTEIDNTTLFLGDLSCFCQEIDVVNAFQGFGDIQEVRVMRSKEGKCLGYGFISFASTESAQLALETMNGKMIVGRQMLVKWGTVRSPVKKPAKPTKSIPDPLSTAEIHFSFFSKQANFIVTEATIRSIFESFGPIQDIRLKKAQFTQRGCQHGYGFVHYPLTPDGIGSAIQATSVICQLHLDDVVYDCSMTHALQQYLTKGSGRDLAQASASSPTFFQYL